MADALRDRDGEPPIILGNGCGGVVASTLTLRHPGLGGRSVIVASGACFCERGRAAFRAMAAGVEAGGPERIVGVAMGRRFSPDVQEALMAERRAAFLRTDPAVLVAACRALAGLDLRQDVTVITVPTLVLVGERDAATPPEMSLESWSLLPKAQFMALSGCAHLPQRQDPARFLAAFEPFLHDREPWEVDGVHEGDPVQSTSLRRCISRAGQHASSTPSKACDDLPECLGVRNGRDLSLVIDDAWFLEEDAGRI